MTVRRLIGIVVLEACIAAALSAEAPDVYAIRGARIVTVSSAIVDHGTVVIRDGLIEAVGPQVNVPRDAVVIDGSGLTVYPGLIDLGNTSSTEQVAVQPLQNPRTTTEVERWKRQQLLNPQARAADIVKVDDLEMTRLASAGITSVLAIPPGEVIAGQSALVNVAAPPEPLPVGSVAAPRRNLIVLKTPVALHVSFPLRPRVGTNAYPVSLMGVVAFVRQSFLDAQDYRAHLARHDAPPDDPALAAMQPAIARAMPVAFEANLSREILRALKLARELDLEPIITGGREANLVASDLQAAHVPVIVSLNYPQRSRALAPDDDEPIRLLQARADAPKTPGELARAGVRFAFESAGLGDARDFLRNAAKAVKRGLPADAALRALTADAAAIAGVGDRLGAVARGKMANLIVTDGDLFDEKTSIVHVFVGGQPVTLEAGSRAPASRPSARP
jgi:imidazolonepropionase-like amidohydrolase